MDLYINGKNESQTMNIVVHQTDIFEKITKNNVDYLIAPVVALVEGVVNGELVLIEEIGKFPNSWSGIPVTLSHPKVNGRYVSANTPDVLEKYEVGRFYFPEIVWDKLRGQIWLQEATLMEKDEELYNKLLDGALIEVSTGYYAERDDDAGTFNGKDYDGVQKNLRPDHLALLPNATGACSVNDGCGFPRNNSKSVATKTYNNMLIMGYEEEMAKKYIGGINVSNPE